jgi:hypothetical protein
MNNDPMNNTVRPGMYEGWQITRILETLRGEFKNMKLV